MYSRIVKYFDLLRIDMVINYLKVNLHWPLLKIRNQLVEVSKLFFSFCFIRYHAELTKLTTGKNLIEKYYSKKLVEYQCNKFFV